MRPSISPLDQKGNNQITRHTLDPSVEAETLKKVVAHSVATALASIVLPVPGGL